MDAIASQICQVMIVVLLFAFLSFKAIDLLFKGQAASPTAPGRPRGRKSDAENSINKGNR
ncbi:hypothetical protein HMPREF9440_01446 [Sutterella parvirubra YIT 11816]|uniref:Uncharacterized protein n=1 Tax=Sutterella parvirubra YIT 11816 TaxID=762967 RepID=H3KFC8_9BURK|nr:hypothetical protein HMPREF9440_01446 [Sutterella parvirubra YIT 11816]